MFTLRKITGKGVEINLSLGNSYTLVHFQKSPEDFERDMETGKFSKEDVYALVGNESGTNVYPLYRKQSNFIVTESGKTFENLTLK